EQNPGTVRGPARAIAERRDFAYASSKGRDDKQPSAVALGAEHDARSIRRQIRLPIMFWRFRHIDRIAAIHLLDPDVEIAATVGTVGDHLPVRPPARLAL